MPVEIPVSSEFSHSEIKCVLDGNPYVIETRWNDREGSWYLTLRDAEGDVLLAGQKIVPRFPIASRYRTPGLPTGMINAFDTTGLDVAPGIDDLGARVKLVYFSADEVAEYLAS